MRKSAHTPSSVPFEIKGLEILPWAWEGGAWAFVCVRVLQIPQQIWPFRAGESWERANRDRSSVRPNDPRRAVEPVNPESCGRGSGLKGG